ncbi:30S ribosome-binding factor RbfA [Arcobacter sp. 15-2]|uniref:30S ribosome-binding factor RbfA n=1 Tax=Arcobacter sp. 15-2 TaxID=3374109 RepID=UPI00399C931C
MDNKSVNLQRTQSLLMELVPEALSSLNDNRIKSLTITDVDCKNGKYDANVYYDGSDYTKEELKEIRMSLRKANGRIKSYILNATSWYKCPDFTFLVDDMMDKRARMEDLFAQISSKSNKDKE